VLELKLVVVVAKEIGGRQPDLLDLIDKNIIAGIPSKTSVLE